MSLFDWVNMTCQCGNIIELQSHNYEAYLGHYDIETAPPDVLGGLDGETGQCPLCGVGYDVRVVANAIVRFHEEAKDAD